MSRKLIKKQKIEKKKKQSRKRISETIDAIKELRDRRTLSNYQVETFYGKLKRGHDIEKEYHGSTLYKKGKTAR
jgi:hypothetical protein